MTRLLPRSLRLALAGLVLTSFSPVVFSQVPVPTPPANALAGREVRFDSDGASLFGRLWLPEALGLSAAPGPHPALVFVPGSGRSISDLHLDPQPLPHRLAADGIALLAFDKRGVRHSEGDFEAVSDDDPSAARARLMQLARDAVAAMDFLRSRPEIDAGRVGVLAFSQGGWIVPLLPEVAGASSLPEVAIVIGGPAVSIGEELAYSRLAREAREEVGGDSDRIDLDRLYERHFRLTHDAALGRASSEPAVFDPLPLLRALPFPSLWLLGERDLSVPTRRSVEVLAGLEAAGRPVRHRVLADADHGGWDRDEDGQWRPAPGQREAILGLLEHHGVLPMRVEVAVRLEVGGR